MVLKIYDYCYFAPARIPSLSLYQLPSECCLGLVTHPLNAQHEKAMPPGAGLVADSPLPASAGTHRKALPAALVATAPAAVIVLQAQEHQGRKDHLQAKETPCGLAREGGFPCLPARVTSHISTLGLGGQQLMESGWWVDECYGIFRFCLA